jgi:GTP-binding protein
MKNLEVVFDKSISIEANKVSFDNKKQIVFVGRSNVGKSSLMNAIFQKKDLVKTSSLPGKTKLANLFKVNNKYHFVDLPGYGFAKLGQEQKAKLDALINWYLEEFSSDIKQIVVVLDSKLGPTDTDIDMFKFLQEFRIPLTFVLNKIDRLSGNEVQKSKLHTEEIFF